jgi:murein DD-endopeptidase MepM/ murein hydrolase activator NlpD
MLAKFGKKAAKFLNRQFALVVIAFFVLSLNVVAAPIEAATAGTNTLINYEPDAVVKANQDIAPYVPIINKAEQKELDDQVLSAVVGPQTGYVPKPLLPETIDHRTADLIRRGLRKETVTHTVEQGETLSEIAHNYGLNVATVLRDNDMTLADMDKIKPGTQLSIASESSTDAVAWLDHLKEDEQKAQEKAEKERQAKLAAASKTKSKPALISASSGGSSDGGGSGKFRMPIIGARTCYNGYHSWAIDCPAPIGSAVVAAAGGTVTIADGSGYNGGYGITIVINHGNGWETRYAHMSGLLVNVGEKVSTGEQIGKSGNTGHSTGPHLHFETHYNGQRINPINLVPL